MVVKDTGQLQKVILTVLTRQMDKCLSLVIRFFELCGFHHSAWTHRRPVKYCIFALQSTILLIFTINGTKYILAITEFMETLGVLNFALFYFALLATYWCIIIESYAQKPVQKSFWELHGSLMDFGLRDAMKRLYLCEFVVHVLLTAIMLFLSVHDQNTTAKAILIYYILLFMCNNRLFYFLLYLKLIKIELQQIALALTFGHNSSGRERFLMILNKSRRQYQRVHEMVACINGIFGWSQFTSILICFYTLLAYFNFTYQQFEQKFEDHGLCEFRMIRIYFFE